MDLRSFDQFPQCVVVIYIVSPKTDYDISECLCHVLYWLAWTPFRYAVTHRSIYIMLTCSPVFFPLGNRLIILLWYLVLTDMCLSRRDGSSKLVLRICPGVSLTYRQGLTALLVQGFYAWTVHVLIRRKILTAFVVLGSVICFGKCLSIIHNMRGRIYSTSSRGLHRVCAHFPTV